MGGQGGFKTAGIRAIAPVPRVSNRVKTPSTAVRKLRRLIVIGDGVIAVAVRRVSEADHGRSHVRRR